MDQEQDMSKSIDKHQPIAKRNKKTPKDSDTEFKNKFHNIFGDLQQARKAQFENSMEGLLDLIKKFEVDYNAMKENEQKLLHFTASCNKCVQQSTTAAKNNMEKLKHIYTTFHEAVEGLLARGAIKPDDRPLWFDVYKAFPPLVEPKFARPKPEITPIRQIFYKEDSLRAEFHSKGHGLGAVNMLGQSNDTQTKRLVQQYEKLKGEGIPEEELIEKSAIAVGAERKEQYEAAAAAKSSKLTPENPNSVTAQVLAEADLKNIFKE